MIFNDEEKKRILKSIEIVVKKLVDLIEKIVNTIKLVWETLKTIFEKNVSIRTRSRKKGKKYIHSYTSIPFFKLLQRCGAKCKT